MATSDVGSESNEASKAEIFCSKLQLGDLV